MYCYAQNPNAQKKEAHWLSDCGLNLRYNHLGADDTIGHPALQTLLQSLALMVMNNIIRHAERCANF
jgi:hypothetical protein